MKQEEQKTVKNFKIETEEVDGISFFISQEQEENEQTFWNFTIMKLSEPESRKFKVNELGYTYQILLYTDDHAEFFEAILGDLQHYVTNMVRLGHEGVILKKCKKSQEIMDKIFKGRAMEALTYGLLQIAKKKETV